MNLKSLKIRNFRNYEKVDLMFDKGIHLITGKNAQGKTNLLESIYYLSTTRSHRTNEDKDLIKEGCDAFVLRASIEKKQKLMDIRVALNEQGKNLFFYQTPVKRVSDFIGEFNAVLFCPDDMTLFNSSPRVRRRFIDMELSKVSKSYTRVLSDVGKLLKERNACLKNNQVNMEYLNILSKQLIEKQLIIIKQRYEFLKDLLKSSERFYMDLSQDNTTLSFIYNSCVPYDDIEVMKENLEKKYEKAIERDCFLKQTTIGIHKEDFMFLLNDKEVSSYASQGQKRSVLLSMKIGIVYMIQKIIQEYPVLLLDDVFSELDEYRKQKLLTSLPQEVQIFISTADIQEIPKLHDREYFVYYVDNGKVSKKNKEEEDTSWMK